MLIKCVFNRWLGVAHQTYRHRDEPSPPPPYEADFNPAIHRHHPSAEASINNRTTSLNQQAQLRQHLQQLQAETAALRQHQQQQQQHSISPRQPALCIIDDGRRDNPHPQLTYHSTKFWKGQPKKKTKTDEFVYIQNSSQYYYIITCISLIHYRVAHLNFYFSATYRSLS